MAPRSDSLSFSLAYTQLFESRITRLSALTYAVLTCIQASTFCNKIKYTPLENNQTCKSIRIKLIFMIDIMNHIRSCLCSIRISREYETLMNT